jgi:hypothetical protein
LIRQYSFSQNYPLKGWGWSVKCGRLLGRPETFRQEKMKTFSAKAETVQRDWFVVDAADKTLGRLAVEIASRLRGKHKPEFTPHVDTGD